MQHVNITFLYVLGNHEICVIHLVAVRALLQWSGTEPTVSLRYVCVALYSLQSSFVFIIHNNLVRKAGKDERP